jgi:AcrR family transcriptional regulator
VNAPNDAGDDSPDSPTAAQARVITAALDLFARHGAGGTSLQMIADAIGVTKAAVYHQYKTKEEIILAAAEDELARLSSVIAEAEAQPSQKRAREALITGIVDLAVGRRRTSRVLLSDPVISELFVEHAGYRDVMHRLHRVLMGEASGPESKVRTAMIIAAISGAVMHPFAVDLDDDVLRSQLLQLARPFLRQST